MIGAQLPLAVQLRESASFESYYPGPNAEAVQALQMLAQPVLLYGPPGSGRSHLLQAAARRHRAAYLPLAELEEHGPSLLEGLETAPAVCIDDLERVSPQREWCIALLRLVDQLRARGAGYVFAADAPPERLELALPDLRTRLGACSRFGLKPLRDDDRRELLRERAKGRGLEMPEEVARWLVNHRARDIPSLLEALERLDREALAAKRRLTLPFVQSVLAA